MVDLKDTTLYQDGYRDGLEDGTTLYQDGYRDGLEDGFCSGVIASFFIVMLTLLVGAFIGR